MEQPAPAAPIITGWSLSPFTTLAQAINNAATILTANPIKIEAGITGVTAETIAIGTGNLAQGIKKGTKNIAAALVEVSENLTQNPLIVTATVDNRTMHDLKNIMDAGVKINLDPNQMNAIAHHLSNCSTRFVKTCTINSIGAFITLLGIVYMYHILNAPEADTNTLETENHQTYQQLFKKIIFSKYAKGSAAIITGLALILKSDAIVAAAA